LLLKLATAVVMNVCFFLGCGMSTFTEVHLLPAGYQGDVFIIPGVTTGTPKKLGIAGEKFKNDVVPKQGAKFNIAIDEKGNVFLVRVQKGQGVAIETGLTLGQLQQYYQLK